MSPVKTSPADVVTDPAQKGGRTYSPPRNLPLDNVISHEVAGVLAGQVLLIVCPEIPLAVRWTRKFTLLQNFIPIAH